MKLTLMRVDVTDHGIFGKLSIENNPFQCVTLERHDICIPTGTYPITLYQSPEHGLIPLLHGVSAREFIEIHEGNWEHDSKGCILVGACRDAIDTTMIDTSKTTLKQLVNILQKTSEPISITVT